MRLGGWTLALTALAAADVGLVGLALHGTPPSTALRPVAAAASAQPRVTTSTPPAVGAVVAAVDPATGRLRLLTAPDGCLPGSGGTGPQVVQHLAVAPAGALETGLDSSCRPGAWWLPSGGAAQRLDLPVSAVAGVAAGTVWWVDTAVHLATISAQGSVAGIVTARDPCAPSGMPAWAVVPASSTDGAVVCAEPASAAGQPRLVYPTGDAGARWRIPAGAFTTAAPTAAANNGLNADGTLVDVASLGGTQLGALLSGVAACPGLQLRLSADLGHYWTPAGCLPAQIPATGARLAGAGGRGYVATVLAGQPTSWPLPAAGVQPG